MAQIRNQIKDLAAKGKCSVEEYDAIDKEIRKRKGCKVLVFGLGYDAAVWNESNQGGETVFIENIQKWIDMNPDLDVVKVEYRSKDLPKDKILSAKQLEMKLPERIESQKWDVIFVDAPVGKTQGRMKSIAKAATLVAEGGTVFIHDYNRPTERLYADHFFGDKTVKVINRLFRADV